MTELTLMTRFRNLLKFYRISKSLLKLKILDVCYASYNWRYTGVDMQSDLYKL